MIFNPNNEQFKIIAKSKSFPYIDKSDFIEKTFEFLNEEKRFMAFTRPRRFGKTVTASMLSAFYSKGADSEDLFSNLKIANSSSFKEYLNKFNVIYLDMNSIEGEFEAYSKREKLHIEDVDDLIDYLQYKTVLEICDSIEYKQFFNDHPLNDSLSLLECLTSIHKNTNDQFILIMDEWDLVYRDYKNDSVLQEKFIDLLRALFKGTYGANCFSFVYLTGILPIKKYNSQSALNNFAEYNMLNPEPFERFFGFTNDEVKGISTDINSSLEYSELEKWYDGYHLNDVEIFNPNSVCCAVRDKKCKSYWSDTASFEQVQLLLNMNFEGIKDDMLSLIAGNSITVDTQTFQNDLVNINNKNDAFCLLICLGYLACISYGTGSLRSVYIPNDEIRYSLLSNVMQNSWYKGMAVVKRSFELYQATVSLNATKVAGIFDEIHNNTDISVLAYNNEESLTYCVIAGYTLSTADRYITRRQLQAGKGVADIIYDPVMPNLPIIIVELKYGISAEEAIEQIKQKNYAAPYLERPNPILLVGINYINDPQKDNYKEHQCIIEKLK